MITYGMVTLGWFITTGLERLLDKLLGIHN